MQEQQKPKIIDQMLGFREQTGAFQLKKWEKNLMIKPEKLTTHCVFNKSDREISKKEEKQIVKDIQKKKQSKDRN